MLTRENSQFLVPIRHIAVSLVSHVPWKYDRQRLTKNEKLKGREAVGVV